MFSGPSLHLDLVNTKFPVSQPSPARCEHGQKYAAHTLPETNIFVPENCWLEDELPFGMAYFQGRTVSFRECILYENLVHAISQMWI